MTRILPLARMWRCAKYWPALLLCLIVCQSAMAGDAATWLIKDQHGEPVADAVVVLYGDPALHPVQQSQVAVMDQVKRQFKPHVLAIQVNTQVSFPNSDDILHHVYSFSAPKPFELELYQGKASKAILFDKPGEVALGCNIHDQMLGYIYIVDSPWFAVSDQRGMVQINVVPVGEYRVEVWHPRIDQSLDAGTVALGARVVTDIPMLTITLSKPLPKLDESNSGLFKPSGFKARYRK